MLSITDTLGKVKTYAPNGYPLNGVKCIKAEDNRELHYQSQSLDGRKIFILRDSFCSAMTPIIGSPFRESIMWHNTTFNQDMIQKYQPDIFVMEMVDLFFFGAVYTNLCKSIWNNPQKYRSIFVGYSKLPFISIHAIIC